MLPYRTYVKAQVNAWDGTVALLREHGMHADLDDPRYSTDYRESTEAREHLVPALEQGPAGVDAGRLRAVRPERVERVGVAARERGVEGVVDGEDVGGVGHASEHSRSSSSEEGRRATL